MPGFRSSDGVEAVAPLVPAYVAQFPTKFWWFAQQGYQPHTWQILFHGAHYADRGTLVRMRHLVAGRRGGKTLSASWEVLFYALHPREYWRDAHGIDSDEPLWIWVLSKSYKTVTPALRAFQKALKKAGLVKGRDYEFNKTERVFEFPDGTLVEFKTADDPDNLRGPGLHILWIEEAAMLPDAEAWNVIRPALSDTLGLLIATTTPKGRNWYWDEFWQKLEADPHQFRVEYTSIDNPHFAREEWEYALQTYHPLMFRQEYMGSFDAMAGVALAGDWLHYYVIGQQRIDEDDVTLVPKDGKLNLRTFMAIDPATGEGDDSFAMALVGVEEDNSQAYLLKTFRDSEIKFPEQIDKIQEWALRYRPERIGVESNAFQRVMVQQLQRLPGMPIIMPVFSRAKKEERILGMGPFFRAGRIRIHRREGRDFIDQWVSYDPPPPYGTGPKTPKDDLLDAVEIALGVAGILLPRTDLDVADLTGMPSTQMGLVERANADIRDLEDPSAHRFDPELGAEFM